MIKLGYKTDRQRFEMESGSINRKLVNIVYLGMEYLSIEYPEIDYTLIVTDLKRTTEEQDDIYLNHKDPNVVKKYKKKPWLSVHQFNRGLDLRTSDMPIKMVNKLMAFFNLFTYDPKRPEKKTCIYHDVGTGEHLHLQAMS
jgi:hypothetical protein